LAYGMLSWSPDSKALVTFRVEPGDRKEGYLIEASPRGGGRAVLRTPPYELPGDKLTSYQVHLLDPAGGNEVRCDVEKVDFGRRNVRWQRAGHAFAYEKTDRGHQRFRLIEVDAVTGTARNIIDEKSETFVWTAHTENIGIAPVTWLKGDGE